MNFPRDEFSAIWSQNTIYRKCLYVHNNNIFKYRLIEQNCGKKNGEFVAHQNKDFTI